MSPYNLVIHALNFSDVVAKIQRALAASFGVPTPRLLSKLAFLVAADGIIPDDTVSALGLETSHKSWMSASAPLPSGYQFAASFASHNKLIAEVRDEVRRFWNSNGGEDLEVLIVS